jgi:hypothetical protein
MKQRRSSSQVAAQGKFGSELDNDSQSNSFRIVELNEFDLFRSSTIAMMMMVCVRLTLNQRGVGTASGRNLTVINVDVGNPARLLSRVDGARCRDNCSRIFIIIAMVTAKVVSGWPNPRFLIAYVLVSHRGPQWGIVMNTQIPRGYSLTPYSGLQLAKSGRNQIPVCALWG